MAFRADQQRPTASHLELERKRDPPLSNVDVVRRRRNQYSADPFLIMADRWRTVPSIETLCCVPIYQIETLSSSVPLNP